MSLSINIVCPFCASSKSRRSCAACGVRQQRVLDNLGNDISTSSSALSARDLSPSASCFCSAARARDNKTSSSFERMTHSKCRSRSSYCLNTSFRRSRTLETSGRLNWLRAEQDSHSIEDVLHRLSRPACIGLTVEARAADCTHSRGFSVQFFFNSWRRGSLSSCETSAIREKICMVHLPDLQSQCLP